MELILERIIRDINIWRTKEYQYKMLFFIWVNMKDMVVHKRIYIRVNDILFKNIF